MILFSTLLIIAILIALTALYVAAEFAAVSARTHRIRLLADQGNSLAAELLPWIDDPRRLDRYISASQIGITLTSLVLGAYGQAKLSTQVAPGIEHLFGLSEAASQSLTAFSVLTVLTAVQVVLGELVPKSIALQFATRTAILTFVPMRWSLYLFASFIRLLDASGSILLRLLGVRFSSHRHVHSREEIELLIARCRDEGNLRAAAYERICRGLQIGPRPVRQLMIPRPQLVGIDLDASLEDIVSLVSRYPYSHLPVFRGSMDNVVGVLHVKDLLIRLLERDSQVSVGELVQPVMIVPETIPVDALLAQMRQERKAYAILVDEFGGMEGMIALGEVLRELLGEVADEFMEGKPQPEKLPGGVMRLPGMIRLDAVEEWIGKPLEGNANTLSGHIVEVLGRFPVAGERLSINGVDIEIEEVDRNTIRYVLVRPARRNEESMNG